MVSKVNTGSIKTGNRFADLFDSDVESIDASVESESMNENITSHKNIRPRTTMNHRQESVKFADESEQEEQSQLLTNETKNEGSSNKKVDFDDSAPMQCDEEQNIGKNRFLRHRDSMNYNFARFWSRKESENDRKPRRCKSERKEFASKENSDSDESGSLDITDSLAPTEASLSLDSKIKSLLADSEHSKRQVAFAEAEFDNANLRGGRSASGNLQFNRSSRPSRGTGRGRGGEMGKRSVRRRGGDSTKLATAPVVANINLLDNHAFPSLMA